MSPRIEEVTFESGGEVLSADLYLPEGGSVPYPCVVMAGGWCYVKELSQPEYAKTIVTSGVAALVFDYRRLGASGGTPRQHLDPWDQIEDYKNAISYMETRDDVDPERIGVWGISYSGGHALILAATDPRIRAAVANVPVIDGYETMRRVHGSMKFRELCSAVMEDRRKRFLTGEPGYIAMSADPADGPSTWPFEEVRTVFENLKATTAPRHEHRNTVASIELLMQYDALPFARRIVEVPTLMIVAERDDITFEDMEVEAFNQIATPNKRLVRLPDTSHMTLYSNLSRLEIAAGAARDWFAEHLFPIQGSG